MKYLISIFFFLPLFSFSQDELHADQLHRVNFKSPDDIELTAETCTSDYLEFLNLSAYYSQGHAKTLLHSIYPQWNIHKLNMNHKEHNKLLKAYLKIYQKALEKGTIHKNIKKLIELKQKLVVTINNELNLMTEFTETQVNQLLEYIKKIKEPKNNIPLSVENQLLHAEYHRLESESFNVSYKICQLFKTGYKMTLYAHSRAKEIGKLKLKLIHYVELINSWQEKIHSLASLNEQLREPVYYPQFTKLLKNKIPDKDIESKINITFKKAIAITYKVRAIEDSFLRTIDKKFKKADSL